MGNAPANQVRPTMTSILDAALQYAARGWPVFPLRGKKPLTEHGVKDATTCPDIIVEWWERWPDANVGLACGSKSADVVDIDSAKGEEAMVEWLQARGIFDEAKETLNNTPVSLTSKGKHVLFQPSGRLKNLVRAAEGVDVRTDGGYIVAPPSVHPDSGKVYEWAAGRSPDEIVLAPFPDWMAEYLSTGKNSPSKSLFSANVIRVREGERNATLFRQAASARARGLGETAIMAMLQGINSDQCDPPLPAAEVERIAQSAAAYPPGGARDAIGEPVSADEDDHGISLRDVCTIQTVNRGKDSEREEMTFSPDLAADVLIQHFDIISTPDEKIWVYHDGIFDPKGDVILCKLIDRIAGDLAPTRIQKETMNRVYLRTLDGYSAFDPDPCKFGVKNAVIDMRTGEVYPPGPEHRLTQVAPVVYDPEATCPAIAKFLAECLDPHDIKTLLQIFAAKTTNLVFEYFSPWIGRGQNGKTKCEDLIRAFWGDDATTEVEISSLGKNRFDLAELRGKRWLINSEVAGGAKESRWIKMISGGGKVTADQKGRDHIEFRANCFIIFDCNNPPRFGDNTHGFSRRIIPILWPVSFVDNPTKPHERHRDPDILEKITTQAELSGLLNALIRIAPEVIRTKTIYRKEDGQKVADDYDLRASTVESFWERFCEVTDEEDLSSAWLYQKYFQFCEIIKATPRRDRDFNAYGRKEWKLKKGRAHTPAGFVQAWKGLSFNEDTFNEFLLNVDGNKLPSTLPSEYQVKPVTGPSIPSQPSEIYSSIENELANILYRGDIHKNPGFRWYAGTDSDSDQEPLEEPGTDLVRSGFHAPSLVDQELSEYERKGWSWHQDNLADEFGLDLSDAISLLEGRGWTHRGRGLWAPPTRMGGGSS